jgi:hypothetical protein
MPVLCMRNTGDVRIGQQLSLKAPKYTQKMWTCDNCIPTFMQRKTISILEIWFGTLCGPQFSQIDNSYLSSTLCHFAKCILTCFPILWCSMGGQHLTRYLALMATSFAKKIKIVKNYPKQ